jgi:hypothetical protein
VPDFVGAPKPMVVRQAIRGFRRSVRWFSIALAMASGSCPSTGRRSSLRIEPAHLIDGSASASGPSIEIRLSSNSTINLLSFRWPAVRNGLRLSPSIRSPSEAST